MKLLRDLSEEELRKIRHIIGDAFVTNELFHELGSTEERRPYVLRYMAAYVDYVYESGALYSTEDGCGYTGLMYSGDMQAKPLLKMLGRIFLRLPYSKLRDMLRHVKQIEDANKEYASKHIWIYLWRR